MNFKLIGSTFTSWAARFTNRPTGSKSLTLTALIVVALIGVAVFLGMFTSALAVMFSSRYTVLLAFPMVIVLGFVFLLNRQALLLGILVLRAGMDPLLEGTQIPIGGSSMGIGALLNGLIIVLTIAVLVEQKVHYWKAGAAYFLPFLFVLFVGAIRSPLPIEAVKQYLSILTFFCTFIIGIQLAEKYGYLFVVKLIIFSSAIPIGVSIFMLVTGWKFGFTAQSENMIGSETGRFSGPFSHANIFAFYLLTVVVSALHVRVAEGVSQKRLIIVNVVIFASLVLLGLTKTRSAWAAAVLILVMHALIFERKFLVYLVIGAVVALSIPDVQERLFDLKDERSYLAYARLNSYEWRKVLWADGLSSMSKASYFYGNGFISFFANSENFFSLYSKARYGAHSVYVQLFYELGLIGVVCFLGMMFAFLKKFVLAYSTRKSVASAGLYLIVLYSAVCYSDNIFGYLVFNIYIWLVIGALFVASGSKNQNAAFERD